MTKAQQRRPKTRRTRSQQLPQESEPDESDASPTEPTAMTPPEEGTEADDATGVGKAPRQSTTNDEDATEEPTLNTDVVFQCGSCRTVLADTLVDYEAHLDSNMISIAAARKVTIQSKLQMSESGFDAGCTFKALKCSHCKSVVGRVYGSTTPALDSFRSTYTFDTTAMISYQLGTSRTLAGERAPSPKDIDPCSAQVSDGGAAGVPRKPASADAVASLELMIAEVVGGNQALQTEFREATSSNAHSIAELRRNLEQAQNMMLLWEERFQTLAACEQRLEEMNTVEKRLAYCESRVSRMETPAKSVSFSPGTRPVTQQASRQVGPSTSHQLFNRPPARLKTSPAITRPGHSPGHTPMRRNMPSPAGTPAKRRR